MALAVLTILYTTESALAADLGCTAAPGGDLFTSLREFAARTGPRSAQPVTAILPADGTPRILFHQQLTSNKEGTTSVTVRMFERSGLNLGPGEPREELPVLAVRPAPERLVTGYGPADSVLVEFQIYKRPFPLWHHRNFVVVACSGSDIASWAAITGRVSDGTIASGICLFVAVAAYALAMAAIRRVRNEAHPLAAKWPAFKASRQITWKQLFNPVHLTANAFNQASVQKLQVIVFSFLIGWMVLSLVLRTGALVDLSATVVGLLGISGIGAAVAQTANAGKDRLSFENWSWLVKKGALPINQMDPAGPRWRDLVTTNREFDIYKLQTLIFSVAVAAAMITGGAAHLASFSVPETLLGILGLSQVVYVGGILVRPPSISDLDTAITNLRKQEETLRTAVDHNVDVNADGSLPANLGPLATNLSLSTRMATATKAMERYNQLAGQVQVMIESTLEVVVSRSALKPDLGERRRMLGPIGGKGGTEFSMLPPNDDWQISQIRISSGAVVDAIELVYQHVVSGALVQNRIGGNGGACTDFSLSRGQFLTRLTGTAGDYVSSLQIDTNQGTLPNIGAAGGTDNTFDFRCDADEEIIGLHGRSGASVDALGVYVRLRI